MTDARILIVDDEPQLRRVMQTALIAEGYEVGTARTGEEAIELMRASHFDLVLLDSNMPGMGGLEACREIRRGSEAAIIMVTVRDEERRKVAALDAGADDYVTKPFSFPELLARIRAALRRLPAMQEEAQTLTIGEAEIDLVNRQVRTQTATHRLTPKEFDLLRYLSAHPNVPLPHSRILTNVWGAEHAGDLDYLRVFVNQLRRKIEVDPASPKVLLTEPWVGYRFAIPAL